MKFTLQTYQDYQWTVNVTQIIERNIDVTGQISSVIDTENRIAIIYVSTDTDLSNIQVNTMNLGGASGTVTPDPTTVHDFSSAQQFLVSQGWEDTAKEWTVYVYHSEGSTSTASIFPRTTSATISGNIQSGQTPVISYKETSASNWTELSSSAVTVSGTSYSADITGTDRRNQLPIPSSNKRINRNFRIVYHSSRHPADEWGIRRLVERNNKQWKNVMASGSTR